MFPFSLLSLCNLTLTLCLSFIVYFFDSCSFFDYSLISYTITKLSNWFTFLVTFSTIINAFGCNCIMSSLISWTVLAWAIFQKFLHSNSIDCFVTYLFYAFPAILLNRNFEIITPFTSAIFYNVFVEFTSIGLAYHVFRLSSSKFWAFFAESPFWSYFCTSTKLTHAMKMHPISVAHTITTITPSLQINCLEFICTIVRNTSLALIIPSRIIFAHFRGLSLRWTVKRPLTTSVTRSIFFHINRTCTLIRSTSQFMITSFGVRWAILWILSEWSIVQTVLLTFVIRALSTAFLEILIYLLKPSILPKWLPNGLKVFQVLAVDVVLTHETFKPY